MAKMANDSTRKFEIVPIDSLSPWDRNPRKNDSAVPEVEKSIRKFGFTRPLIVAEKGAPYPKRTICAGHTAWLAAKKVGLKEVPIIIVSMTEQQFAEYNAADNRTHEIAEWDQDALAMIAHEFKWNETEIPGYSAEDIAKILKTFEIKQEYEEPEDEEEEEETESIYALRDDMDFHSSEPFDFPDLVPDKIAEVPKKVIAWTSDLVEVPDDTFLLYLWATGSMRVLKSLDRRKLIIAFYVGDERLERFWADPAGTTQQLLDIHPYALIGMNYSAYYGMPQALRLYNIYRSRWLARYWQEAGLFVIPDISGAPDDLGFCFGGLPKGLNGISIQAHVKYKNKEQEFAKREMIMQAIRRLDPKRVLFYGAVEDMKKFSTVMPGTEYTYVQPWYRKATRLRK